MLGSEVAGPDDFVRMPWQSFSTMKRFISEGNRLENASWRLWHMQRLNRLATRTEAVDDPYDDILRASRKCVYCNFASATLSCNGCCHDVYCVGCFKLIHMRGHLATHTAVKLLAPPPPSSQQCVVEINNVRPGSNGAVVVRPAALVPSSNKVWEHKMDALFQKFMVTSMHHDGDISVHNLPSDDTEVSLSSPSGHTTEHPSFSSSRSSAKRTPVCNTCKGPHITILCPLLQPASSDSSDSHCSLTTSDLQCANCHRAHVLTECPLLPPSSSSFSSKKAKRLA
ncbi:hypothetical protein H257_19550, partial [Aphanomyces astaci]